MSLATRCPACGTTFRIESEQLALADGWARCGRCSQVFDAAAERREHVDAATAPAVSPPSVAVAAPAVPATGDADAFGAALLSFRADAPAAPTALAPVSFDEDADPGPSTADAGTDALSPPAPPTPAFDPWRELPSLGLGPDAASPVPDRPERAGAAAPASGELPAATPVPPASPSSPSSPVPPVPAAALEPAGPSWQVPPGGSSADGPSGVRPAARAESVAPAGVIQAASEPVGDEGAGARTSRAAGRRRFRRAAVVVAAILLLLVLLAQVLYRQRDAVAARHPALRPILAATCGVVGCTVGPLRRPADIAIEGATFTHAPDRDRYRLAFALSNQADVPLAMPAIELSLLDAQERAVVRRVLAPAEFGVAEAVLPALAEREGGVAFDLVEDGADGGPMPRIAGYALVAFYP